MEVRDAANAKDVKFYTTDRLREEFHISGLFPEDEIKMVYSHIDRIIVIGMKPVNKTLTLEAGKELAADYFLSAVRWVVSTSAEQVLSPLTVLSII